MSRNRSNQNLLNSNHAVMNVKATSLPCFVMLLPHL
jgi:hypothetical protein